MQGRWVKSPKGSTTVVFIHGILSDGDSCWRHDSGPYWPELLAQDEAAHELGIYVFTYNTGIFSGSYRLGDAVDAFKEHTKLDKVFDSPNVVLVCHSMGGIVARKFVTTRALDLVKRETNIGLFLIASPSLGSSYADWLAPLAKLLGHAQADALKFTKNNSWLLDLDTEFKNLKEEGVIKLVGKELVEDRFVVLPGFIRKQVVEPFSGERYFGDPYKVPNSDHFSIAKIKSKEDIQHRLLLQFIEQVAKNNRQDPDGSTSIPLEGLLGVPNLSRKMLPRTDLTQRIVDRVTNSIRDDDQLCFYLKGPGGFGKSTLATLIARDSKIRSAFPDGIFWMSVGQNPDISARHAFWLNLIPDRPLSLSSLDASTAFLVNYFSKRQSLIILDDVWDVSDLTYLKVAGPKCRVIITGREQKVAFSLDAVIFDVGGLSSQEAQQLLVIRSGKDENSLTQLTNLAVALDRIPLALELAAYQLKSGVTPDELIQVLTNELDLIRSLEIPGYENEANQEIARNLSINACLNLSLRRLPTSRLNQFAQLSIFEVNTNFGAQVAMKVWDIDSLQQASDALRALHFMSLLEEVANTKSDSRRYYRMHSVIRAKATVVLTSPLNESDKLALGQSQQEIINRLLRCSNKNYPKKWHLVEDDGHTIDNLIFYLTKWCEVEAQLSILETRASDSTLYSPNAWFALRLERAQEEFFYLDVSQIHTKVAAADCRSIPLFEILTRSFLTLVSLNEMNKGVDVKLCIDIVRANLWSEGVAASHARRHFRLGDIAAVAQVLSEPLRSRTIQEAVVIAQTELDRIETASEFVRCAVVWEGPLRTPILEASIKLLEKHLQFKPGSWLTSNRFSRERLIALRAALNLSKALSVESAQQWSADKYALDFVRAANNWRPPEKPITAISYQHEQFEYESSIIALETLLHIAIDGPENVRPAAKSTLAGLQTKLVPRKEYSFITYKLKECLGVGSSDIDLKTLAVNTLSSWYGDVYARIDFRHELSTFEGCSGFSKLIARTCRLDVDFFRRISGLKSKNECCHSFLEYYIFAWANKISDKQLGETLGIIDGLIYHLTNRGSIAPSGVDFFKVDQTYFVILRALVRCGAVRRYVRWSILADDLSRVRDDSDRVKVLEIIIPSVDVLTEETADKLCAAFANIECEALARLIVGTKVGVELRERFLNAAVAGFANSQSSIVVLRAFAKYASNYSGDHLRGAIRSATASAEGIGDAGKLKAAYARASIGAPDEIRSISLRAGFWYSPDSMPSQPSFCPLPRHLSLMESPFWASKGAEQKKLLSRFKILPNPEASRDVFLDFVISYLCKIAV